MVRLPFKFTVDSSADSFTSRGILDEVIASDILDTDTYDQIYAQYRFNAGTADFVVGLHSFAEDRLLVFNRNSIHIVENTMDEYNLRGTETPLSEPINETIKRINKEAWDQSVAIYFDNRYYIAVPLDASSDNNAILVYNFLNQRWESIDTVDDGNYHTTNMMVVGDGNAFNGSALAVDEDVSIRGRIGNRRGYGIQFTINNTSGRPRIRAIEVEGSVSMRSITKAT
jgi:hypothetical protein